MYFLQTVTRCFSSFFQYLFFIGINQSFQLIFSIFLFIFPFTNKNDDDILEKPKVGIFKILDYDFDEDERREKFKDYDHVLCERCNQEIERKYFKCENCFYDETDINEIRRMKFGKCKDCFQINKSNECSYCNPKRFEKDFDKWTSGNETIDKLIQDSQLLANVHGILEWIPYNKFKNIKYIAEGGFAKVYSATWIDGPIKKWDHLSNNWKRDGSLTVALKMVDNSNKELFLNEIKLFNKVNEAFLTKCFGITQDPVSQNFVFVLQYMKNGDLRTYLNVNFNSLTWERRLDIIYNICYGVKAIHDHNLIHRDLHPGNILVDSTFAFVGDFGFCMPANEIPLNSNVYGVMPYMAPEILRRKPYTQASDIYSLGIIINEVISAITPFNNEPHDSLALNICYGKRPKIREETPGFLKELIVKCWDENPDKRPTSKEILCKLPNYFYTKQVIGLNSTQLYKTHSQAIYLSEPKNYSYTQRFISSIQMQTDRSECLECDITYRRRDCQSD